MLIHRWVPSEEIVPGEGYLVRGSIVAAGGPPRVVVQPVGRDGGSPIALPEASTVVIPMVADADGLTDPAPGLAWMPASRARFAEWCDRVERWGAEAGAEPVIWPGASGVVSDVPSILTFLRARPRWRFIFDPIGLLTPSMLPRAEEHLTRLYQSLGGHEAIAMVVLTSGVEDGGVLRPVPLASGEAISELLLTIHARHTPRAGAGIVLLAGDESQEAMVRERLEPAGAGH